MRRNIIQRAKQAEETRRKMIEAFFRGRVPSHGTIEYAAMLHDVTTSALVHHLRYLIRSGELDRVEGVYRAFENRADRHRYIGSFDEIAAQGVLADSGDELAKRLARICQLAQETDAKLTNWWLRHISPKTRNGIADEPAEAHPNTALGSNVESSDADEVQHCHEARAALHSACG